MKDLKICLLISACIITTGAGTVLAQNSVSSAGGDASSSGGSVSYTLGQVAYTSKTGSGGAVAQGVQQPYEISAITGNDQTEINLEVSAYPNPTKDFLNLTINTELKDCYYRLFDGKGNLLKNKILVDSETPIEMTDLPSSIYFLKIYQKQVEIKSFRIVKY